MHIYEDAQLHWGDFAGLSQHADVTTLNAAQISSLTCAIYAHDATSGFSQTVWMRTCT